MLFDGLRTQQGVLCAEISRTHLDEAGYKVLVGRLLELYQHALFASYVASKFIYTCGVRAGNVDFYKFASGLANKV